MQPAIGRVFTLEDDRVPGGHPVVVLSHALLDHRHFGGDPSVLNQSLLVNNVGTDHRRRGARGIYGRPGGPVAGRLCAPDDEGANDATGVRR